MLVPVSMYKAEKYAVDMHVLDEKTRTFFLRNFGCARKVYNLYVDYLYNALEKEGYVSGNSIPKISFPVSESVFKKTYPYLKEADSLGLMNARLSFETALKKYLENSDHVTYTKRARRRSESGVESLSFRGLKGMPKFHSKAHGDFSYKTNCQYPNEKNGLKKPTVRLEGNVLYVPKLKDGVRLIIHRKLPKDSRIGNVTFSMDTDGRIFASVEYRYSLKMEMDIRKAVLSKDRTIVDKLSFLGLDYSQQNFYVDSEGRKANYPHWYRKSEAKIIRLQRELSHMEKGSSNYGKQLKKIERLHIKIRNQRLDFVRKEAARLASSYDVIAVENIDLRAMGQTLRLSKNLHDNGFGMFRNILSRKLEEKGSVLVKVDRFFASTKSCSCCGEKSQDVVLGVKEWVCPVCGTYHDRDVNAAINIREEAKRIFPEYFFDWLTEDAKARQKEEAVKKVRRKKKSA